MLSTCRHRKKDRCLEERRTIATTVGQLERQTDTDNHENNKSTHYYKNITYYHNYPPSLLRPDYQMDNALSLQPNHSLVLQTRLDKKDIRVKVPRQPKNQDSNI